MSPQKKSQKPFRTLNLGHKFICQEMKQKRDNWNSLHDCWQWSMDIQWVCIARFGGGLEIEQYVIPKLSEIMAGLTPKYIGIFMWMVRVCL